MKKRVQAEVEGNKGGQQKVSQCFMYSETWVNRFFFLLDTEPEEERSDDIIIVNYAKLQSEKKKRMKYKGERKKNPKGATQQSERQKEQ